MSHAELIALVGASYLMTLWVGMRWRRFRGRVSDASLRQLSRIHVRRALAGLGPKAEPVVNAIEAGNFATARVAVAVDGWERELAVAAERLAESGALRTELRRYQTAAVALRAARRASRLGAGAPAAYLEVMALVGFLSDVVTEDIRLLQAGRRLRVAIAASPHDPLLQLAAALRFAVAGQPGEAVAALARALYHARGDPFVAQLILAVPLVEELSPGLAAEARQQLGTQPG